MGLGTSPLGTAPYGYGSPPTAPIAGGLIFDDGTGKQTGSRMISEKTRQYVFNSYGRIVGMDDVRQLVLIALTNKFVPYIRSILDIGSDFQRRIENAARQALAELVARDLVELVEVTRQMFVTPGTSNEKGSFIRVRWRKLETGEEFVESLS